MKPEGHREIEDSLHNWANSVDWIRKGRISAWGIFADQYERIQLAPPTPASSGLHRLRKPKSTRTHD